jgi:drug/metabolite transporter (DMT)-like permease
MLYADATVVVPMDFLCVALTAAAGWLICSERLGIFTLVGAVPMLAGNFLNLKAAEPDADAHGNLSRTSRGQGREPPPRFGQ